MPWKIFDDQWSLKNWISGMNTYDYDMGQGTNWSFGNLNLHFVDNHDQQRFLAYQDWDKMLPALAVVCLIEGVGGVYYGSEQCFNTPGKDGRGAYPAMFAHPFEFDNAVGDNFNMCYWMYKKIAKMLAARRQIGDGLGYGTELFDPQNGIFAFKRGPNAFIAINGTNGERTATYNIGSGNWVNLIDGSTFNGNGTIRLAKYDVGIWVKDGSYPLEPIVESITPAHGTTNTSNNVIITFDQNMDPTSTLAAVSITPNPGGTWSLNGKVLTLSNANFQQDVIYTVKIANTAKASATGKQMYGGFISRFKGTATGPTFVSPEINGNVVTFNYVNNDPNVTEVYVRGSWIKLSGSNGVYTCRYASDAEGAWSTSTPMVKSAGRWKATITFEPNKYYEYKFNYGSTWLSDPLNSNVNPQNSNNSYFTTGNALFVDKEPPVFSGLQSCVDAQQGNKINLSWNAASDTTLPIRYNIYYTSDLSEQQTKSYVNKQPAFITTNTSYTVTGLTKGVRYYFIVRAEDGTTNNGGPNGGNQDTNLIELSAIPTGDIIDNDTPQISSVAHLPATPTSSNNVTISANIVDFTSGIKYAILYWTTNNWTSQNYETMVFISGVKYSQEIPAYQDGVTVKYKIKAVDNATPANETISSEYSYLVNDPIISPSVSGNRVTFYYSNSTNPQSVTIKGSWKITEGSNGNYTGIYDAAWAGGAETPMVLDQIKNVWKITITLPYNQTYEYGFMVNNVWTNDPLNNEHATNGNDKFTIQSGNLINVI
ncbi:MAG TPA: Ig-like domain-containing protein, partial [bacterium]|nr:Ig-like domain-containing protein [bacterium]